MRTSMKLPTVLGGIGVITVTSFPQSVGAELVVNGANPIAFTADNPNSWNVIGEVASDPMVTEVASNEGHLGAGTGCVNFYNSATAFAPAMNQTLVGVAAGDVLIVESTVSNFVAGRADVDNGSNGYGNQHSAANNQKTIGVQNTGSIIRPNTVSANTDITFSLISAKKVTLNPQIIVPANSISDFFFSLPASPILNQRLFLTFRIQDSLNLWMIYLTRIAANWNIDLARYNAGTRTTKTNATSIGNINGIRADCNGDTIKMWTTADSGGAWTQRGITITDSSLNSARGLNTFYNAEFTPSSLVNTAY